MRKIMAMTAKKTREQHNATAAADDGDDSETLTASWHVMARMQYDADIFPQDSL